MTNSATPSVRPAAVAGYFYDGERQALRRDVENRLSAAGVDLDLAATAKALIVPHAGYRYSGDIAAKAFRLVAEMKDRVRRVVLLGPAHRVAVRGIAVPDVQHFETPLGRIPLDRAAIAQVRRLPFVATSDLAHRDEHSLEVQLPFLQCALADFELIPAVVGAATGEQVEAFLELLWGGPETLVLISSDLSHFHEYGTAQRLDRASCSAIEHLAAGSLEPEDACGARPIDGLLRAARRHGLQPVTLDLRNSGDTAGDRDRVVGYGAWVFTEPSEERISPAGRQTLLKAGAEAIRRTLGGDPDWQPELASHAQELTRPRASFVTLERDGNLQGCIGNLQPSRPLLTDVAANARAAAFADPRFSALRASDLPLLRMEVAVLSPLQELAFSNEADLQRQLLAGIDGLVIEGAGGRATFLPKVWEKLPDPQGFLDHLKAKAGLARPLQPQWARAWRYRTEVFAGGQDTAAPLFPG